MPTGGSFGGNEVPRIVWIKPGTKLQYVTTISNDPGVPAGYFLSNTADGSGQFADSATDQDLQTFVGGLWSGGYPSYDGPPGYKTAANANNANGILGG
jgi:hypothetical protein